LLNKAESVIEKGRRRCSEKKSARKRYKMSKKACAPTSRTVNDIPQKRVQKKPLLKASKYQVSGSPKKKIVG
jgi:hypothetical protein